MLTCASCNSRIPLETYLKYDKEALQSDRACEHWANRFYCNDCHKVCPHCELYIYDCPKCIKKCPLCSWRSYCTLHVINSTEGYLCFEHFQYVEMERRYLNLNFFHHVINNYINGSALQLEDSSGSESDNELTECESLDFLSELCVDTLPEKITGRLRHGSHVYLQEP